MQTAKSAISASQSRLEKNNLQLCFCCWHYTKSHQVPSFVRHAFRLRPEQVDQGSLPLSPHLLLLQITFYFFRNLGPRKRVSCQLRSKCLICPWAMDKGKQVRSDVKAWLNGSWGERISLFPPFSESLNQYPTCNCTRGHRNRGSNTDALKSFKFDTLQRQKHSWCWISWITTIIFNHLGRNVWE